MGVGAFQNKLNTFAQPLDSRETIWGVLITLEFFYLFHNEKQQQITVSSEIAQ